MCLLNVTFGVQGLIIKENHPIVADFSMAVSLGTLPMSLEINTTSCGSTDSVLAKSKPTESELMSKLFFHAYCEVFPWNVHVPTYAILLFPL